MHFVRGSAIYPHVDQGNHLMHRKPYPSPSRAEPLVSNSPAAINGPSDHWGGGTREATRLNSAQVVCVEGVGPPEAKHKPRRGCRNNGRFNIALQLTVGTTPCVLLSVAERKKTIKETQSFNIPTLYTALLAKSYSAAKKNMTTPTKIN